MSSDKDIAIRVENLSKMYRLGSVGTGTLSHDLNVYWHKLRGKGNPYSRVGEENNRELLGDSDYVWALRDINFEVKKGEILGIIGKNGAGKSTLLKILSRITGPTEGSIKVNGRMASLLEVGTGFHPELTGRENIYLNGAIMGMTKREITSKLEEIVDFSGCARYIDTPVKRYSSGMTVRLGFAVAAFLEPEILIVDEVLAVGDAEFQKKAIGKMQDVSKGEGRTVLFVSHNMASMKKLCNRGVYLENGLITESGTIEVCSNKYLDYITTSSLIYTDLITYLHEDFEIKSILINNKFSDSVFLSFDNTNIEIEIRGVLKKETKFDVEVRFFDLYNNPVAFYSPGHRNGFVKKYERGEFKLKCIINLPNINNGKLKMGISLTLPGKQYFLEMIPNIQLEFEGFRMNTGWVFQIEKSGILFLE